MFNHAIAYILSAFVAERNEEKGATAVEYALVIGLVSIVIVGAIAALGPKVTTFINGITF
ncbi:MAG: Flp family type IVb pilin [Aeromicrobium sp.]|nr:Flp family type IVb pilin [Aeromicrobium sp.]